MLVIAPLTRKETLNSPGVSFKLEGLPLKNESNGKSWAESGLLAKEGE